MNRKHALIAFPVCFFIVLLGGYLPNFRASHHLKPEPILKSLEESSQDHSKSIVIDIATCKGYSCPVPEKAFSPFLQEIPGNNPLITVCVVARPPPAVPS